MGKYQGTHEMHTSIAKLFDLKTVPKLVYKLFWKHLKINPHVGQKRRLILANFVCGSLSKPWLCTTQRSNGLSKYFSVHF